MTVSFLPVQKTEDFTLRVSASIAGGSGTGKTYSACLLADGLADGKPFAFIDTENKRALHYRRSFPNMVHFNFGPQLDGHMVGFPPERWIAQLDHIEKEGFGAVVIDSFSHAWEGIGGVLEMQADTLERLVEEKRARSNREVDPNTLNQLSWVEPKQRYRRLVERIVQSQAHVILCIRAKPVMQTGYGNNAKNARPTKLRRADIPWDIASDKDLIFEMTASMILEPERPGEPVMLKCPDHFRSVFRQGRRLSKDMGDEMRTWAEEGGEDPETKKLLDDAQDVARKGMAALDAWWKALPKEKRPIVASIGAQLRSAAEAADQVDGDDMFSASRDEPAARDPSGDDVPASVPDTARLERIATLIRKEIGNAVGGEEAWEVLDTYREQLAEMKTAMPETWKEIQDAAGEKAAA